MSALEQNIEKLSGYLARFKQTGIRNRIGGEDRDGGQRQRRHGGGGEQRPRQSDHPT